MPSGWEIAAAWISSFEYVDWSDFRDFEFCVFDQVNNFSGYDFSVT